MRLLRLCLSVFFVTAIGFTFAVAGVDPGKDKAAIKKTIEAYVDAFNKGDAKALAAHWTKDGQYVSPEGEVFEGREKLEAAFEGFFKNNKGIKLEVKPLAIYVESANKAIEEGMSVTTRAGEEPETTRYVTSYVKQDGAWKISKVKEVVPMGASSNAEKLKPLEWMIGEWVDKDETGKLETSCHWSANGNFIVRSFSVTVGGQVEFGGKQIIGWDPVEEQIRSWVFDSNGGFGEGVWRQHGDSWYVNSTITLSTGERASSINILTPVDENSYTWASTGRAVGGELLPNTPKVTVVRLQSESTPSASGEK
jgi:uncharacterized protein (TIGR02246 family)